MVNELTQQVARVRRHLWMARLLRLAAWCLSAGLLVGAVLVGFDRYFSWLGWTDRVAAAAVWLGSGAGIGLVVATVWSLLVRPSRVQAAIELDHQFGLQERISSVLSLPEADLATPAGQALLSDALKRARRVELGEKFKLRPRPTALVPLAPLALGVLLAWLVQPAADPAQAAQQRVALSQQQKETLQEARKALEKQAAQARQQQLNQTSELITKLTERLRELEDRPSPDDPQKPLIKLNELAEELRERQQQVGEAQRVKQQLSTLKNVGQGPAQKLAEALKAGEFKEAAKHLNELQKKLANSELSEEQKKQLGEQFAALQKQLQQLAEAQQKAQEQSDQLQKQQQQLAQNQQQGQNPQQPDQPAAGPNDQPGGGQQDGGQQSGQQQADNQQGGQQQPGQGAPQLSPQLQQLSKLAEQLGQAQQDMQQGQNGQASQAMQQAQQTLNEMSENLSESQMLSEAMQQIAQAKQGMTGQQPGGQQSGGQGQNQMGGQRGNQPGQQGQGGQGQNQGGLSPNAGASFARGTEPSNDYGSGSGPALDSDGEILDAKGRDSQLNTEARQPSAGVVVGYLDGPNAPGQVVEGIKQEVEAARTQSADPLSDQRLPRRYYDHAREYFDSLRSGD